MDNPASQKRHDELSDIEFTARVLDIIRGELGLGGLARFLRVCCSRKGDYTAERHQWLEGTTIEGIAHEMELKK